MRTNIDYLWFTHMIRKAGVYLPNNDCSQSR